MILIDLNQVMISNMMAQLGGKGSDIKRGFSKAYDTKFYTWLQCKIQRRIWSTLLYAVIVDTIGVEKYFQITNHKENKQEKNLHTIGIIYLQSLIKSEMN